MNAVLTLTRSTVGKKVVMASTGAVMVGWLTAHMVGNLQVFLGQEVFDHYAELIQSQVELLWLMRLGMLTMLVLHVSSAIALVQQANRARPVAYQGGRTSQASTPASKSLRYGGVAILLFLIFHLADLTAGVPLANSAFEHGKAYANLTFSLQRPHVAAVYILANLALGMHLYHGVYSIFQTLGFNQIGERDTARKAGTLFAFLVAGGNILIALGIVSRIVGTVTP
ncbi:MAG: succinate dehydrogenase cytochrome b subunit [Alphaproteobacteria bacterium]|nr:succinate dehydrogenase cytochrome b subunit [Alphaproteobacteria bacterium]